MAADTNRVLRISHISLSIRDLARSTRFYAELFGMREDSTEPVGENARRCGLLDAAGEFGVVLKQGHPSGVEPRGLDHFSFEVPTSDAVVEFYRRARHIGAQATEPRVYEGHWQTFIFDPDGYKIEVLTREPVYPPGDAMPGEFCENCAAPR